MKNIITIIGIIFLSVLFYNCKKEDNNDQQENEIKLTQVMPDFVGQWREEKSFFSFNDSYFISIGVASEAFYEFSGGVFNDFAQGTATIENNVISIGFKKLTIDKLPSNFHSNYWDMTLNGIRYIAMKSETNPECNQTQICVINNTNDTIEGALDAGSSTPLDKIPPGGKLCYGSSLGNVSTWGAYSVQSLDCETDLIINW